MGGFSSKTCLMSPICAAHAKHVKTCNRLSVTTAPSLGLVQYCSQAMGILHLPKIGKTTALPETIASMLQPTKIISRLSPPQWLPFPQSIPLKLAILKKRNERWKIGKETSLFHCPLRAFFFSVSSLPTTQRERERAIQTINYHSRLQKFVFLWAPFSFFSFFTFSGWL